MSHSPRFPVSRGGFAALLALLVLAACSPRQAAQWGPVLPDAKIEQVYVVTERQLDDTGPAFGEPRNQGLRFFRADISIPPVHQPGKIEWHERTADPARHFVVTQTQVYEGMQPFKQAVHGARTQKEVLIFIHGYNNTLSEAMYRLAQIQTDFAPGRASVLFSWPSAGDPRGYAYDRDSVLFARDDLERLITTLTQDGTHTVTLLAHSMGSQLVMEVMRQAALRGDRQMIERISSVVLMSPDIDPDVFRKQAEAIGVLPDPFLIFTSREDRALGLAGLITGRKPRLGTIDGPEAVEGLDVTVIDFTELGDGEGLNHSVPTTSPSAISVLRGMIAQAEAGAGTFDQRYVILEQKE